jgi:hypothetical protein
VPWLWGGELERGSGRGWGRDIGEGRENGNLDLLAKDDLDFGRVLLRDDGLDGCVDCVEHFGREL